MSKEKLWFKAKRYGWGWYPVTWQGWVVVGVFLLYTFFLVSFIGDTFESRAGATSFLFLMFLGLVPLLAICYAKGETPSWRWGGKKIWKR